MSYQVDCSEDDGFVIASDDEEEVIEMTKEHARDKHDMDMSEDEVREMMEQT